MDSRGTDSPWAGEEVFWLNMGSRSGVLTGVVQGIWFIKYDMGTIYAILTEHGQ